MARKTLKQKLEYSNVAGRTSTLSKHPQVFPANYPKYLSWASGTVVRADDGKEYLDWIAGLLSVTLGHRRRTVTDNVVDHLSLQGGPTWSLRHRLEDLVAERILRRSTPYMHERDWQVRFLKTGSEACAAAVRVARAVTERSVVLSCGYHGWHDALLSTPPAWGVSEQRQLRQLLFNDLQLAEEVFQREGSEVACVIIEPETAVPPDREWLLGLRALCEEHGALLIFDECITGGRYYPAFTAGQHYDVMPDLFVMSKGLANGYPLACLVGRHEHLRCFDLDYRDQGPVYVSGTYSCETASLAAAYATLDIWSEEHTAEQNASNGAWLRTELVEEIYTNRLEDLVSVTGPDWRLILDTHGNLEARTLLMQELANRGVLIGAGWNAMSSTRLSQLEQTADAWHHACVLLAEARQHPDGIVAAIKGAVVRQPYRQA